MARAKAFDLRHLDVRAFAEDAAVAQGSLSSTALPRLSGVLLRVPSDGAPPEITWHARGELRKPSAAVPEVWLQMEASTLVHLECQRCLQPMPEALNVSRWFRFVATEEEAERLDEDSEDDVLAASRRFDLQSLLEDELILALPLVPRHAICPQPLSGGASDDEDAAPANPFAALAALRRTR